jgi:hypothetical protein
MGGPTLGTNLVSTGLIAWKAWQRRISVRKHLCEESGSVRVDRVFALLIESGFIYCCIWVCPTYSCRRTHCAVADFIFDLDFRRVASTRVYYHSLYLKFISDAHNRPSWNANEPSGTLLDPLHQNAVRARTSARATQGYQHATTRVHHSSRVRERPRDANSSHDSYEDLWRGTEPQPVTFDQRDERC